MILVTAGIVFSWNSKDFRFYSSFTFPNLRVAAMLEGTYCRFLYQSPRSIIYQQCTAKKVELGFHEAGGLRKLIEKNTVSVRGWGRGSRSYSCPNHKGLKLKTRLLSIYVEENYQKMQEKANRKQNLTKQTHKK